MFERSSGILMPIFSLPNNFGIGNFGESAYRFVDFLAETKQSYWQILPLTPTGYGDSPYSSFSAFAGNTYFIDFDLLAQKGYLKKSDYTGINYGNDLEKIDYGLIYNTYKPILKLAVKNFMNNPDPNYQDFIKNNADWLNDYALFMALKEKFDLKPWYEWDDPYKYKDMDTIYANISELQDEIDYHYVTQYFFSTQWEALKGYANRLQIKIIGDLPIYVSHDSADVWANPELFLLDEHKNPTFLSGTPPDAFTQDGQFWGNPLYDWPKMEDDGYSWWLYRIEENLKRYDVIRLDHFRGFEAYWQIPAEAKTAAEGYWVSGPGIKLFDKIKEKFPKAKIIAEDLGHITTSVRELLKATGYPGLKVIQFGFNLKDSYDLPHHYQNNTVAYVGTHDNMTARGWYESQSDLIKNQVDSYTNRVNCEPASSALNRAIASSVSNLAIYTMQDLLNLDNSARINEPGTLSDNWTWRMKSDAITSNVSRNLLNLTKTYFR